MTTYQEWKIRQMRDVESDPFDSPSDGAIYSAVSLRDMTPEEKQLLWRALLEAAEILYSLDESEPNAVPLPAPPEGGK